jgi:SpoVK/Ycf46/Vps4 family AAA+-type ATPase
LWIDEAEKGLSGTKASGELDSGVTARVVGTILTWMQEKTAPVFVIATANDVSKLPPELLRKGRFDEIFFVDLPNEEERFEIVKIQLKKRNRELHEVEMKKIVEASKDYTGAEIEQAVIAGLYECFEEKERKLTSQDVVNALKSFVPLSTTMQREIDELRDWGIAQGRARNASLKVRAIPSFLGSAKARTFTFKKPEEKVIEEKEAEETE